MLVPPISVADSDQIEGDGDSWASLMNRPVNEIHRVGIKDTV